MIKITCEINSTSRIIWYKNNFYHNNHGPAAEWDDGTKCWAVNGNFHRLDGPAWEGANGDKEWWIDDIEYNTELEYWLAVQNYNNAHE